jgi:hypothetical protein
MVLDNAIPNLWCEAIGIGKLLKKTEKRAHTSSDNLLNKARLSAFLNSSIVL